MTKLRDLAEALGLVAYPVPDAPALFFGKQRNLFKTPVALNERQLRCHGCIVGCSGSGAFNQVANLLTQQTERGGGWLFIDVHGDVELRNHLAEVARLKGRADEFQVVDLAAGTGYHTLNLMLHGSPEERALRVMLGSGGARYTVSTPSCGEAPGTCEALEEILTTFFQAADTERRVLGLRDVAMLMLSPAAQSALAARHPNLFKGLAEPMAAHAAALQVRGRRLLSLRELFGDVIDADEPQVDLADTLVSNKMLYVSLPMLEHGAGLSDVAAMLVSGVRSVFSLRNCRDKVFLLVLEQSASYIDSLPGISFSIARGMGVSIFHVLQDLASLTEQQEAVILANAKSLFLYRNVSPGTLAKLVALHRLLPSQQQLLREFQPGEFMLQKDGAAVRAKAPFVNYLKAAYCPSGAPGKLLGRRLAVDNPSGGHAA